MASITTFSRLEPEPLRPDVTAGASAPVQDPLWLLARQWQVGEFVGQDGGTPVVARWRGVAALPTRFVPGPIPPNTQLQAPRFDAMAAPLETLIERVGVPMPSGAVSAEGLRLGVDTGRLFLRLLADQTTSRDYGPDVVRAFAVAELEADELAALDRATAGYARLHAGRSLDGRRLRAELEGRDLPRLDVTIEQGDRAELRAASADWLRLVAGLFADAGPGAGSWQPSRFEYTASLGARRSADAFGETTLTAARYDSDTLDWYEFDVNGEVNLGTTPAEAGEVLTRTLMPAAVTAPGLPARRFWEFEDGRLNLASLQPAETDLAQLLLIETLSGFGNDWFVIGVELPVGRLVSGRSLVVTDTFGTRTLLRPHGDPATGGQGRWGLFQQAMPFDAGEPEGAAITNLLYLAPRLAQPILGPVVEQVVLARDEQANLGWAVEQLRESPLQVGVELSAARPPDAPGDPDVAPDYHLAQVPPPHWIPLLPVRPGDTEQIALARGSVLDVGGRRVVRSVTDLLGGGPDGALLIPEEEVPAGGIIVQRSYQAARWVDGSLHVWAAHRTRVSSGLPPSGVRYDYLIE
jgi:tRNA threonylcarbamoyladenosine modification (KEOPS) complex  Pcc1 subunit